MWLFLFLVGVPILEIALFINVGGAIGVWPTLGIVILTALIGSWLIRTQGLAVLGQVQSSLRERRDPSGPIANGALILVAGILLLTPGFFTDALGLSLLVPQFRAIVIRWGAARLVGSSTVVFQTHSAPEPGQGTTIDAEYEEVTPDDDPDTNSHSVWTKPR